VTVPTAIAAPGGGEIIMPRRLSAKLFAYPDTSAPIDLRAYIGIFHRLIQNAAVEGLLVDVADYSHVPDGPGVVLIGHEVDYGIDLADGRAGLLTTSKRSGAQPLAETLRDTLRRALLAARAVEGDAASTLRFGTAEIELRFVDSLETPNSDEAYRAVCGEIESVVNPPAGDSGLRLVRANADDPRKMLTVVMHAADAPAANVLIDRLGSAEAA
jgi:hypothetical protein